MTTFAKLRSPALIFEPKPTADIPAGAIYMDSANSNALTTKTTGGTDTPIGEASSADVLVKIKQNKSGVQIPANRRVALKTDGSICLADNNDPLAMVDIGVSLDTIEHLATGRVLLDGPNAVGVLTGSGFTPGQTVLLGATPGTMIVDQSVFDPATDTIKKVGIADCAAGNASATVSDLICVAEVISSP